jgi:hypothetical protein
MQEIAVSRVLYMAVVVGFVSAVAAVLLNGMHLHSILNEKERLLVSVSFLLLGALIGAIAGATSAIVEAIGQQKQMSERKQP